VREVIKFVISIVLKNVQKIIQIMNLNRCQFTNSPCEAYYKTTPNIDDGDDDENGDLEDDNEPKDISRQTSC
jgi:hypothetical protein